MDKKNDKGRERSFAGRVLIPGSAEGAALISKEPLSFWGGLNPDTGEIIDRRHDRSGAVVTDRIFIFPRGRGSSTGSAILLESISNNTHPAAIINQNTDPIIALGAIVADELYHHTIPVIVLGEDFFSCVKDDDIVKVEADGRVVIKG